jgi:hypothetical protein
MQVAVLQNVSKLAKHAQTCQRTPLDIKREIADSTQDGKKRRLSYGNESMSSSSSQPVIEPAAGYHAAPRPAPVPVSSSASSSMSRFVYKMTKEVAEVINFAEVEAMAARFEPINRCDCPFVRRAAIAKNPSIESFLPSAYTAVR